MKRYFLYAGVLLLALSACRKTEVDNLFADSPEGRMADTLAMIRKDLTSAQYGWKAGLQTGLKGGYGFYFQFTDDNKVKMVGDFSTTTGSTLKESTYRVSPTGVASLIFDTYNHISLLQDPVPDVAGGTAGQGFRSDVEFSYQGKRGDSLFFTGKKYSLPLVLIKATNTEQQAYQSSGLNTFSTGFSNVYNTNYAFSYALDAQANKLAIEVDYASKAIKFSYVDATGEVTSSKTSPYYYTTTDLSLVRPLFVPFAGKVIKAISYAGTKVNLIFTDGSNQEILNSGTPLYNIESVFAYNKAFKKLVSGATIPGVTANVHIFDQVRTLFTASSRNITNMYFGFTNSTTAIFYIAYTSGTSSFVASATYEYRRQGNSIFFKRIGIDGGNNWNTRATQVAPVNDLFGAGDEREFTIAWASSSSNTVKFPIGAIKSVANPNNMLYGRLGQ
ncbi:DUF4302 domain-containing protein [Pedobacter sp.]|uniref:DUF4302 domain-containing protein n=1 Tax=Pedobacter sp. TaxID=1411316 RepID=UPI0031D202A2